MDALPVGGLRLGMGRRLLGFRTKVGTGRGCIVVESSNGADAGWQANVPVKPYSRYRLTAFVKTEGVEPVDQGLGALINIHSRSERTEAVAGTKDWTPVALNIDTGPDDLIQVNCILGYYGTAKGRAYFDDVSLQLLETQELKPQAVINARKTFDPIPKYIYSQFIEHFGRCIYGGIWAEMLDDRKFYYDVDGTLSPWQAVGGAKTTMDPKEAFVGEHTPRVEGTGGVSQGKLSVEAGKSYVGRVWIAAEPSAGPMEIALRWGAAGQAEEKLIIAKPTRTYKRYDSRLKSGGTTDQASLSIRSTKQGAFHIGAVSLMPADNVSGMRRDTLTLLKELNAPLYRWPGGNFVSGYDWRDGIGDPDRRPPRKNPAWSGIEHNDFGTHEFLEFCRLVNTEPLIVVNTGFGDAYTAAAWLQYVNGPDSSEEGQRRTKNGRKGAWDVKWWGIGNEMFGPWQLGHMSLDQYVVKHKIFYDRMTKISPDILTIASSDLGFGGWSERMLRDCANQMTLISEHFYCQERQSVPSHVAQVPNAIRAKVVAHRRYRDSIPGLKEKNVKIAMDEWNYWYGPHVYGELGTRYFVKDGLGIAAGLHEYFRSTDIVGMAQYAQTVNVIGCIKTTPTAAAFETTGLVLMLYRQHFGTIPLSVEGAPAPLDVSAALTADKKTLTLGVVNPTAETMTLPIEWKGIRIADRAKGWEIANSDSMAYNTPGQAPNVKIEDAQFDKLTEGVRVKPYSVTLIRIPVEA